MELSSRFIEALAYAAELHGKQRRKLGSAPYLAHLLAVAALVLEYGGDETAAIAALLHDAVEDQGGKATAAEIHRRFGPAVAEIVQDCSDTDESPKPPWTQRKEAHLARLRTAGPAVLLVVAADKLHNVQSTIRAYRRYGDTIWQQFRAGREGVLWYFRAVTDTLYAAAETLTATGETFPAAGADSLAFLLAELDRAVSELEHLAGQV